MKLWTVWCDYGATGEGRSVMAWIGYAKNKAAARAKFTDQFGEFFTSASTAAPGIVRNEVTQYLFSESALKSCDNAEGRANVDVAAHVHFNFS